MAKEEYFDPSTGTLYGHPYTDGGLMSRETFEVWLEMILKVNPGKQSHPEKGFFRNLKAVYVGCNKTNGSR